LTPTLIISFGIANIKGINLVPLPAGLIKNANNTFPATKISFINTIANICEKIPGADITAYDPVAVSNAKSIFGDKIKYASSAIECLKNTDCCILVTE